MRGIEDQEAFFNHLGNNNNLPCLKQLVKILKEDLAGLDRIETTLATYESSNWANKQAHINGMRQSIQKVLRLLSFVNNT